MNNTPPFNVLAVITARGGSKGIPGKNIALLGGKPLIQYSIESANKTPSITDHVVSTDSVEIAEIARSCGGNVPFLRPEYLSRDDTPHLRVVRHALEEMEKLMQKQYDFIITLQPTSPFRLPEDIEATLQVLIETGFDSAVTVCEIESAAHPCKAKKIDDRRLLPYCMSEVEGIRRQDLPIAYKRSSAVYISTRQIIYEQNRFYGDRIAAHLVAKNRSIDIDSPIDFIVAEYMLSLLREEGYDF